MSRNLVGSAPKICIDGYACMCVVSVLSLVFVGWEDVAACQETLLWNSSGWEVACAMDGAAGEGRAVYSCAGERCT